MPLPPSTPRTGFTLIELMVVVAVVAILATIALPSLRESLVRGQIVEASKLAEIAKGPIGAAWAGTKALPADNASIGLPNADKIVSHYVTAVTVEQGAIHIRFGNRAHGALQGKTLSLRPAVVEDAPVVPITWVCGHAAAPPTMSLKGSDRTDVAEGLLPLNCKAGY